MEKEEAFKKEYEKFKSDSSDDECYGFSCGFDKGYDVADQENQELKEALRCETECVDHIKEVCDGYEKENQELKEDVNSLMLDYNIQKSHYLKQIEQLQSEKQELIEGIEKNKNLLIDACEHYTSADNVEMDKYDLESWIAEVGNKLNLAMKSYITKHKQNGNNI